MPATRIIPQPWGGNYPSSALTLSFAAGDTTNNNAFYMSGDDYVILTGVGTATLQTVDNAQGRSSNLSVTLATGDIAMYHANQLIGFQGAEGLVIISSAATVQIAVMRGR
jgi:hypothetical protein